MPEMISNILNRYILTILFLKYFSSHPLENLYGGGKRKWTHEAGGLAQQLGELPALAEDQNLHQAAHNYL